jgi:transposase
MALADGQGRPAGIYVASASPHEVTLVAETLQARFVDPPPERLIGDRAYDSDGLDAELAGQGITMIAPNRRNRSKSQDGRALRRYKRRWKVERLFAWLGNYRRLVVRYEVNVDNFVGFVHLGCVLILLRQIFSSL